METASQLIDYKALYEQQQLTIIQLRHELEQLKKMIFATRSERFQPADAFSPQQLSLGLTVDRQAEASCVQSQKISYTRIINTPENIRVNHAVRNPVLPPKWLD